MFSTCTNLNQNIVMPDSVIHCSSMFYYCLNLDQPIKVSNNADNCQAMFSYCINLNSPITISRSVLYVNNMFQNCTKFASNIYFEGGAIRSVGNMLNNTNRSLQKNIFCRSATPFLGTAAENSITGTAITWSQMADGNGYYNTTWHIDIYNNYTGSGT